MSNYDNVLLQTERELLLLEQELDLRELARNNLRDFVPYVYDGYESQWFHIVMAEKLQMAYERKIQKLMLFLPPQHGKSQVGTRGFPAWVLGKDPDTKVAVTSYSADLAAQFNREIQRTIDSEPYTRLFPGTKLNASNVVSSAKSDALRNSSIFEVVGRRGSVKTVGVGGGLTGSPVDIGIVDDPIKSRQEAQSATYREMVWSWYTDVFKTRLHNHSVQIIILTRWDPDDLAGRLLLREGIYSESNPRGWMVVSFPAIRTKDVNDFDPRKEGEPLWPERHDLDKLMEVKKNSALTFNSLYQQDPKPSTEALIFPDWIEIPSFPEHLEEQAFYGGDFGFSNHPTAFVKMAIEGKNLYCDEQFYETGLTNPAILQRYHALGISPKKQSYWDGAEPKSIQELNNGAMVEKDGKIIKLPGINAVKFYKPNGSISAGINKLHEYTVHYTARSRNIKHEVNHYQWAMFNGASTNEPLPNQADHAMDAIRSTIFTRYQGVGGKLKNIGKIPGRYGPGT